jgi:hypothetical protein
MTYAGVCWRMLTFAGMLTYADVINVMLLLPPLRPVSIRQHTSAYASIRQHTPAYVIGVILLLPPLRPVSIRQHTPAYASIRQHTS